ncbi:uncharacterized protein BDR25DRAFT_347152 [Lindgomyces ingoldianus]|uniref:Uncharacterized protein n=1 Tax=Lindgomyces ingoldianus TaxID=673940 RepID=A0ACB6QC06_9PLEO|nr:uncharacterized protein BDR25DRAFT_347152 [Lindgomyces ingoldianus]KAF2463670.1 hypothetical protein BDR25DRAFT_347152 [Lindgomyces ingoldianus]
MGIPLPTSNMPDVGKNNQTGDDVNVESQSSQTYLGVYAPPDPDYVAPEFPPDARLARINNQITSHIRKPWDKSKGPASIQGIGSYTHVRSTAAAQAPLFPHQRYLANQNPPEFLPLEGGQSREERGRARSPQELPENVKAVYEALKCELENEEKNPKAFSSSSTLPISPIAALRRIPSSPPPPHPRAHANVDVETGRTDPSPSFPAPETLSTHLADLEMGGVPHQTHDRSRRMSAPSIIGMDSTGTANVSGNGNVTGGGNAVTGTYDASRDPRRKGR